MTDRELTALSQGAMIIPLTQNRFAIVDTTDHAELSTRKWCVSWNVQRTRCYAVRKLCKDGRKSILYIHRHLANPGTLLVDHKNGDTLDNRRSNLRKATNQQNNFNARVSSLNALGIKGVKKPRKRFAASITHNRKLIHLGTFDTLQDATTARNEAAMRLHGEFFNAGFTTNTQQ